MIGSRVVGKNDHNRTAQSDATGKAAGHRSSPSEYMVRIYMRLIAGTRRDHHGQGGGIPHIEALKRHLVGVGREHLRRAHPGLPAS